MIYQVSRDDDTSSSCSECKKEVDHRHEESSEQSDQGEPSQNLLSRHTHSHAHPLVPLLQEENKRLKMINQDQEREIKELRIQLEMSKIKNFGASEMARSTRELPKFKVQGQITPKGVARLYSPEYRSGKFQSDASLLQVALLQKQIKQLQLRLLQTTTKMREYEQREGWMHKFIVSFVNMAEELSVNLGGKMVTKGATLRKKTKMSWKYIKELINYLIK